MSTTQFGGPGSAFSFAAPTRPSRRANSSTSFKDAAAAGPTTNGASSHTSGPAPVDPPAAPSLGSFTPSHERENALSPNGTGAGDASGAGSARSFSSILSPSLSATANGGALGEANGMSGKGKPFVYSREFLLSLYDEEKAKKRPLELAAHETATRDLTGSSGGAHKPWLLQEYREGEKEVRGSPFFRCDSKGVGCSSSLRPSTRNRRGGSDLTICTRAAFCHVHSPRQQPPVAHESQRLFPLDERRKRFLLDPRPVHPWHAPARPRPCPRFALHPFAEHREGRRSRQYWKGAAHKGTLFWRSDGHHGRRARRHRRKHADPQARREWWERE